MYHTHNHQCRPANYLDWALDTHVLWTERNTISVPCKSLLKIMNHQRQDPGSESRGGKKKRSYPRKENSQEKTKKNTDFGSHTDSHFLVLHTDLIRFLICRCLHPVYTLSGCFIEQTRFCLLNCLNSLLYRFIRVLEIFPRDFGPHCIKHHASMLHVHDVNPPLVRYPGSKK